MDLYGPIKCATESTISWLVETALDRGCDVRFLPDNEPEIPMAEPRSARLKGKARKQAKKATNGVKSSSQSPKPRIVSEQEILRLARLLQEQKEILVVPKRVRTEMRRAFLGRRFFADKYAREEPDSPGNAPHAHFVGVLSQLLDILTPVMHSKSAVASTKTASVNTDVSLSNLFQALALPDDDDDEEEAPVESSNAAQTRGSSELVSNATPILYKAQMDSKEEARLRLMCLKVYVEEVIGYVTTLWTSYFTESGSPFDLAIITLVTEVAISKFDDLVWGLKAEIGPECPWEDILKMFPSWLLTQTTLSEAHGWEYPKRVARLHHRIENATEAWTKEDTFLTQYLGEAVLEAKLRQMMNDSSIDSNTSDKISRNSRDCLTQALLAGSVTNEPGLKTFFAVDLLRAVRRCAGENLELPYRQLRALYDECDRRWTYLDTLELSKESASALFPMEQKDIFDWIDGSQFFIHRYAVLRNLPLDHPVCGHYLKMLQHPDLSEDKKQSLLNESKETTDLIPPIVERDRFAETYIMPPEDYLFYRKSNPLVGGKLVLNMLVMREEADLRYAGLIPEVFSMCHLYNALSQLGMLTVQWPTLERITELYLKPLFSGARPTTVRNTLTRFMLACGYSMATTMMVVGGNLSGTRTSTIEKLLKTSSTLSAVLTPTPLMEILRDYCHDKHELPETVRLMDKEMIKTHNASSSKKSQVKSMEELGSTKFLETLFTQLQQQKAYFEIDLIEMTHICAALFRKMVDTIPDTPALAHERANDWRGAPGFFITRAILLQLCASDGADETLSRPAVTVLQAYLAGGASGTPL